jgi:septal ring factor EnvC (AmiA/AmiB activator)
MPSWPWRPAGLILAVFALWAVLPMPAVSQDESTLRNRIERSRSREQALSGAVARLSDLLARTQREIGIVQARLSEVEADLATARARLAATQAKLNTQRSKLARLRRRLAQDQDELAAQLVASYKGDDPDIVSLVIGSSDFADLIERVELAKRLQARNGEIVDRIHASRDETHRETDRLAKLEAERQATADAVERRRNALASMRAGLAQRQATFARVRTARAEALAGTRAGRAAAERELNKLIAEREAAARATSGGGGGGAPSGPWAIPWAIVQCESGGQNLPPNGAGASGYYQMLPSTWRGLGGSTPNAYQASKAEQDRLAAALWAGGSGAHNWVCAGLVG